MRTTMRSLLETGKIAVGTCIQFPSREVIEVLKLAGHDFVYLDLEHGTICPEHLLGLIMACDACGMVAGVRVPGKDEWMIAKALEMGATAIKVPGVETAEEARRIVSLCKYPPEGALGGCPHTRNHGYGTNRAQCFAQANANVFISIIVESVEGLHHLKEIICTPGVDCVVIGKGDLSRDMGLPVNSPQLIDIQQHCAALCGKEGKCCSVHASNPAQVERFAQYPAVNHYITEYPTRALLKAYQEICNSVRNAADSCS